MSDKPDKKDEQPLVVKEGLKQQRSRYSALRKAMTATAARVEFLRSLLEQGISKREAARMLSRVDSSLSSNSAETIVYMNFSGVYQTSRCGERRTTPLGSTVVAAPKDVTDDEGLL